MKITAIILLAACLSAAATGHSQSVTLSMKDAPLEKVFTEIRKQTGYNFLFSSKEIKEAGKVTLQVSNASIEQVLMLCFKSKPFEYSIDNNTIVVKQKAVSPTLDKGGAEGGGFVAPPVDIKGRITDENSEPLVGATIKVKGTTTATKTDGDGRFTLTGVDENATLEISYVGFETTSVKVESKTNIALALKRSDSPLDVVVIQAYGKTTDRLKTGNISRVSGEDIAKQPVSNPLLALEGRVPGLFITQTNGLAGGGVTVRIQGQNSIGMGNDPLYVIDGVPYISQMIATAAPFGPLGNSGSLVLNGVQQYGGGNPLSFINPSDIESIEILKDADATAIYGSRAANGAILITTKKGKSDKTITEITLNNGWGKVNRTVDLMNAAQYLAMKREALRNDNIGIAATDYDLNGLWDTTHVTDWQKELIGKTANYLNVNGNVSGGNATTKYLISGTYHKETSVFPGDFDDKKGTLHFNVNNTSPNQKFRIELSANYLIDNNQLPSTDLTGTAITLSPVAPALYNSDGSLNWAPTISGASSWANPLAMALYQQYQNKTNNLISNVNLSYNILPGLQIKNSFGYTNLETNETVISPLFVNAPESRPTSQRAALYSSNSVTSWIIEPQVTYKRRIYKGTLELLAGGTIQQTNGKGEYLRGSGYNSDLVLKDIRSAAAITVNNSINSIYKYRAFFGRVNYNWQNKFILNVAARRDGSSRFGPENQFHNFGSVGGAWIFTQEEYIKKNISILSFGKLRASYGTTGNDQIGDYQFMDLYNPTTAAVPYQSVTGLAVNRLQNPYLQWEETKKLQLGLDLGFIHDRILFSTNVVVNRSSNQLLSYALPIMTGFTGITRNFPATVQNSAVELTLNTVNFKNKKFNWTSSFNLTIPENKLISFKNLPTSSYSNSLIIGQPISIIKAFHFLGVNPGNGIYIFSDARGNATSAPNAVTDKTIFINTLPQYYGGFQNSLSYQSIELDFIFQFVKQLGVNNIFGAGIGPGFSRVNHPASTVDHWQNTGDISSIQRYTTGSTYFTPLSNAKASDAGYSDASYIRLKNVSLAWNIPSKWNDRMHLQRSQFFLQGQNLLTITKFPNGVDPETRNANALPPLRIITIGLKATL